MHISRVILFAVLAVLSVSCHSTDTDGSDAQYRAWLVGAIKEEAASHRSVLLVRVNDSRLQRRPYGHYQLVDSEGTVVHCYKGDWKAGGQISLHEEFESVAKDWKPHIGELRFILTDQHVSSRIDIDIDIEDRWEYRPMFDRALQSEYRRSAR